MSTFLKELINSKLKQLSAEEVMHYGNLYGFRISKAEANEITVFLKKNSLDPFNASDRTKAFKKLEKITSSETAKKAEALLAQLISSYGLDSFFN